VLTKARWVAIRGARTDAIRRRSCILSGREHIDRFPIAVGDPLDCRVARELAIAQTYDCILSSACHAEATFGSWIMDISSSSRVALS